MQENVSQKRNVITEKSHLVIKRIILILISIQALIAGILLIKLLSMQILTWEYIISGILAVVIFNVLTGIAARKQIMAVFMSVISLVVSGCLIWGLGVVLKLDHTFERMSQTANTEIVQMAVIVLEDSPAVYISDISGYPVGYMEDESAGEIMQIIDECVDSDVSYHKYGNALGLTDGLLTGMEEAIILNQAYVGLIAEQSGYEDFAAQIRILKTIDMEVIKTNTWRDAEAVSKEQMDIPSRKEDCLIVYISGIDTFGGVNVKSRSDVNILAVINRQKGQIQLINTPRDYYISLPESGAKDKLTHAGLYGIPCSEGALEELYGIEIDYYLRMNFSGFEQVIDTLGGIDVYSEYDFTVEPVRHYTTGYNHLSGIEALAFARERYAFASGDIQRGRNQMEVIKAMIRKLTSVEMLKNYDTILDKLSDAVQTDIPSEVLYDLVQYQLKENTVWEVNSYTVTGTGSHATTYSMPSVTVYVMLPEQKDIDQAKELINNTLSEE